MTFGSIAGDISLYALLAQFLSPVWLDYLLGSSLVALVVAALLLIRFATSESVHAQIDRDNPTCSRSVHDGQ